MENFTTEKSSAHIGTWVMLMNLWS